MVGFDLRVLRGLRKEVSGEKAVILHEDPYKTLIATILSARTRDENTAKVVDKLFSVYSTPKEIARAPTRKLETLVRSSGFYRVKARRIKEVSKQVVREFDGKVPENIGDLLKLRGVGRKTANACSFTRTVRPRFPLTCTSTGFQTGLGGLRQKRRKRRKKRSQGLSQKDTGLN
jgi:endonuclease-3